LIRKRKLTQQTSSFNRFAWALARCLRIPGIFWEKWIAKLLFPKTHSVQLMTDRVLHLNEALGLMIPSLTHVLSRRMEEGSWFAFRPFTDDADKISQSYEQVVRRLLSPCPSEIIVDIGANIGWHTVWLSKKVGPSGKILAVEPEVTNFAILELNTPINNLTNVISINLALGANQGRGRLFVPRPTLMGQVTTEGSNHGSRPSGASVSFDTLDNLVKSLGIDQVSAIKVDVEGAELAVIRGAEKTISKFGPRLVIEVHGNDNLTSLRHVMKSMNMRVVFEVPASPRRDETRVFVFAVPLASHLASQ